MPGSKTNTMTREEILAAVRSLSPEQDYVWDGVEEDDRPASDEELESVRPAKLVSAEAQAAVAAAEAACKAMNEAAKQVAEMAEANLAASTNATGKVVGKAPKAKKAA